MLYALSATVRHFQGQDSAQLQITVGEKDSLSGARVYRGLDDPWAQAIIDSNEELTKESIEEMEDRAKLDIKNVKLEMGRTFSEQVPTMFQYFTDRNGIEQKRAVTTVSGVITANDPTSVDERVSSTMRFRLTALDENGQHRYGIPKRKSTQLELLQYWDGGDIRNFDETLDGLVDELESEEKTEAEA